MGSFITLTSLASEKLLETKVWVVGYNREKGAWSLAGTRLLEKFRLLARVLVKTMAVTSV
jgi:hypothetical protein